MELSTMRMDVDGGVAHVQLTRGAALNTMNAAFWTEIVDVFAEVDRRGDVRCAVLSSTGKHFTAGLDLAWAASDLPDPAGDVARRFPGLPLVAAGYSLGGNFALRLPVRGQGAG